MKAWRIFPEHGRALPINPTLTSSYISSSAIRAVSRVICIILGFRRRLQQHQQQQWQRRESSADEVCGDDTMECSGSARHFTGEPQQTALWSSSLHDLFIYHSPARWLMKSGNHKKKNARLGFDGAFWLIFLNRLSLLRHFKYKIMIQQILMFGQIANRVILLINPSVFQP